MQIILRDYLHTSLWLSGLCGRSNSRESLLGGFLRVGNHR